MTTGTIAELFPMDGLGWIEAEGGQRILFSFAACKDFSRTLGLEVMVSETKLAWDGATQAVQLRTLKPGTIRVDAALVTPSASRARTSLACLRALDRPVAPILERILARWDSDDAFYADLETLCFEVAPMLPEDLGFTHARFLVIAMDGCGNAYGLDVSDQSWLFWDHELDVVQSFKLGTEDFFASLLSSANSWMTDKGPIERVRDVLAALEVNCRREAPPLPE